MGLRPQVPGQCLLQSDARILEWSKHLWLDNLYFRFTEHPRYADHGRLFGFFYGNEGDVWMANVTLQGQGPDARDEMQHQASRVDGDTNLYLEGACRLSCTNNPKYR